MSFDPNRPVSPEPFDPAQPATFPPQPVVPTPAIAPRVKPKSSSRVLNGVLAVAVLVAVGGVSFAVGRSTAPVAAAAAGGNFGGGNFGGGNFGGGPNASLVPGASGGPGNFQAGGFGVGGGLTISGTVESVSADSLTVTTASGQTVTFSLTPDTGYRTSVDASAADVTAGAKVDVEVDFGAGGGRPTASADASSPQRTATSVTVVP